MKTLLSLFKILIIIAILYPLCVSAKTQAPPPKPHEQLTNDEMRTIMIQEVLDNNPDCVCPYSADRIGGLCGTESAYYYQSGDDRIYCYLKDISNKDIYFYRMHKATPMFH